MIDSRTTNDRAPVGVLPTRASTTWTSSTHSDAETSAASRWTSGGRHSGPARSGKRWHRYHGVRQMKPKTRTSGTMAPNAAPGRRSAHARAAPSTSQSTA